MDLNDFGRALRRFWPVGLIVLALTVAAGFMAARAGGPTYSSTAIVSVAPNPADPNGIDQVEYEVPVIVAAVESRSVGQQIEAQVGAAAVSEVNSLTAEREIESNIVRIEAEGSDPSAVADVANAAATVMLERYQPTDVNPLTPPERGDLVTLEVIDAAVPDAGSGYPNLMPIMLATVCLGLILAGASVALTQKWVRRRDLEGRIRTEVGVPVLAVIPGARELASEQVPMHELLRSGPPALIEAFQTLRSRIELLLPESEAVVAISSWHRKEGRTAVTAGLGLMLTAVGEQAVVVDCNLRQPDLAERLGEPGRVGLAEYAETGNGELIHATQHARLELIPAGVARSHPAQLLAVALPAALSRVWQRSPQAIVLLDAPPLGPVLKGAVQRTAETSTVLGTAGRVLLVTDAAHADVTNLAVAVERLEEDGVAVIGVVVNRRRPLRPWSRRRARATARPTSVAVAEEPRKPSAALAPPERV